MAHTYLNALENYHPGTSPLLARALLFSLFNALIHLQLSLNQFSSQCYLQTKNLHCVKYLSSDP